MHIPACGEFCKSLERFYKNEKLAAVYFEALAHVQKHAGDPDGLAAGIKLLLRTWNRDFYRFGDFDLKKLTKTIKENKQSVASFRDRDIETLCESDENQAKLLYGRLLEALEGGNRKSPAAAARALHLLAPNCFPLWDNWIAQAYGCMWNAPPEAASAAQYLEMCKKMKEFAAEVRACPCAQNPKPARSLLKMIDEYNYAKYSKYWV